MSYYVFRLEERRRCDVCKRTVYEREYMVHRDPIDGGKQEDVCIRHLAPFEQSMLIMDAMRKVKLG